MFQLAPQLPPDSLLRQIQDPSSGTCLACASLGIKWSFTSSSSVPPVSSEALYPSSLGPALPRCHSQALGFLGAT